jgi:hypothetical protein
MVPMCLEEVIEEGAWRDRVDANGRRFSFRTFVEFIEAPEPKGLGTTKDAIRKYLGDSSSPLRIKFEAMAEDGPGGTSPSHPTPLKDQSGRFVMLRPDNEDSSDTAIPNIIRNGGESSNDQLQTPKPQRDRSKEPQAGTSVGYAVRRLEREAKEDPIAAVAYERLQKGEITANAAMIEVGFRTPMIQVPADPSVNVMALVEGHGRPQSVQRGGEAVV